MKTYLLLLIFILVISGCKQKHQNEKEKSINQISNETINVAPSNPFASDGVYAMPHGDPAQQDATKFAGPLDKSRQLSVDEIQYVFTGPASIGAYTSPQYSNGKRVLWLNSVNGVMKIDNDTYENLAHLPSPLADKYTEEYLEKYVKAFNDENGVETIPLATEASNILKDVSGVYAVVDKDNRFYVADKDGNILVYGDKETDNPNSEIELKGTFKIPAEASGPTLGMNMTYDGWIILPTEEGYLVAVSRDLSDFHIIRLKHAEEENTESRGVGYGWVRNSIAIDEKGGIYVASRNHMHKIIWTGNGFSTDEKDGAWTARYSNSTGHGTGATPSLMGFGKEDKFVVITDGDTRMNVTLFWRDEIPNDWKQLEGSPSRRIAGFSPVTMGDLNLQAIQTEQSAIVAGYGVFVVNNTPRNKPNQLPQKAGSLLIGHLGSNPNFQPFGVQKFEWNPEKRTFQSAWVNTKVSSPNGVPYVSLGSNRVYFIGARNNKWTLEALNWDTGESDFHYVIGGQKYNSLFSGPVINEDGSVMYGTSWGRAKLTPIQ
jgi:hypothetical protein